MSRITKFQGVETTVESNGRSIRGIYRGTCVAAREGRVVTLNSGGWRTTLTKMRMNQFAHQFCGGLYSVTQREGKWTVTTLEGEREFRDGMQFTI